MKIKDIRQYRSYYKKTRPVSQELEEHFIGNYYIDEKEEAKKFGWFTMYHGDRDGFSTPQAGIENFLQSFLDMAKDGQAVYEFLQNAVDAGSTHYTMLWGKDSVDGNHYLLVANNGEMFTPNSIRSILNVGSSTKNADSQTIGKFGIGFKLAHRLVGKDNGLQELINENSGPILFSWKNYELEELGSGEYPEPSTITLSNNKKGEIIVGDDNPWLFKILITCFPCLPENDTIEEVPKMADGVTAAVNPFSKAEYAALSRWVKNHKHILNRETYGNGALFFLKLGSGKENELAEINLKEGVKFALAILRETADSELKKEKVLRTVQLNNEPPINYPRLEYLKLLIDKEQERDTYAYIRFGAQQYSDLSDEQTKKIKEEANIEALFGFRKHHEIGEYFKGAPNFYLYFPLSEEVHNFNYILHSNAFYKGSSRTFLHKGSSKEDGINERLLRIISEKVDFELDRLSSSNHNQERALFLDLYAALLTSAKSTNEDRQWIDDPYIKRMDALLLKYVPVRKSSDSPDFYIAKETDNVYIKKTQVDINLELWGLKDIHWFYWGDEAEAALRVAADSKLKVKDFTIFHLLTQNDSISNHLDNWINGDQDKVKTILSEIAILDEMAIKDASFKKNLFETKLLAFNTGELLSIIGFQEKEKEGYFIIFNTLHHITDLFQKLNLKYTYANFDDYKFNPKYFSFFGNDSQVKSYTTLTKLFSNVVKDDHLTALNKNEKLRIFDAFRTLNDTPGERMGELKLLSNNLKRPVCFKNLFANSTDSWLNKFCVSSTDDDADYKKYLLDKPEQLYQGIIFPFWEQIANLIAVDPSKSGQVLDDVVSLYEKSDWQEKAKHLLSSSGYIIYQSEVVQSAVIFFHEDLALSGEDIYSQLQKTALAYYGVHIPDRCMLSYMEILPFFFIPATISPGIVDTICTFESIDNLLLLSETCNIDFFAVNTIYERDHKYFINSSSGKKQFAISKPGVIAYLNKYYPENYTLIPERLAGYKTKIELSDSKLIDHLISLFEEGDDDQELDLIEVVLLERLDDKKTLLAKLTFTNLDGSWEEERQNELYVRLLKEVVESGLSTPELAAIHNKISIRKDDQTIVIGGIDSAHDSIEVKRGDKTITLSQSQILNLVNADNIKFIQAFSDEARKRELLSQAAADKLFKISNAGITDELVERFTHALDNNHLENSHQLLFVLLSDKFRKEDYHSYLIKSLDGTWYDLADKIIIYSEENKKHISSTFLLDQCYGDLQSLLQLSDLETFNYSDAPDDIIAPRFLFLKGLSANVLDGSEDINDKLNYLNKGWLNLPAAIRDYKRGDDWADYLGISPDQFILNGIQTQVEFLPENFIAWTQNDRKKEDLLKAIGVYVGDSPIERLRKSLMDVSKVKFDEFVLDKFNETILLNTLKGLTGDFIELNGSPIVYDELNNTCQLNTLERIINLIGVNNTEEYSTQIIYRTKNSFNLIKSKDNSVYKIDEVDHSQLKMDSQNRLHILYNNYQILRQSPILELSILEKFNEIELSKSFIVSETCLEHDEPFYHNWKMENSIRLFKEIELRFSLFVNISDKPEYIGNITEGDCHIKNDSDFTEIYYTKNLPIEHLYQILVDEESNLAPAIEELIKRKNAMLSSLYNALNAAGKGEVKSSHLQALEMAFREENLKQERKDLIDSIKTNTNYSYDWFESYLKFLLTFESKQSTTTQKSITFQEIKHYIINGEISDKYFLLCGASSLIPLNIEDFEDFKITLVIKNRQNENIKAEGVSKKGQDLLIYCREALSRSVIGKFADVIQLKISFSPVIDLLQRLFKAFSNKTNIDEWDDIYHALPNLQFIYGPPGTGKTTALCSMILDGIAEKHNAKYLVLTPTNKASDVLSKKLLRPSTDPSDILAPKIQILIDAEKMVSVTRLGKPTDPELEDLDEEIYQDSLTKHHLDYTNILATTIHRLPYFEIIDEAKDEYIKLFRLQNYWDYIILDEASMINLPYLVFAILSINRTNPNAKFVIAGDPKQIPPVIDVNDKDLEELDIQDENVYSMMGIKSFKPTEQELREGDNIINLNRQFRSVKKIGQLFSDLSYDGLLIHDREERNDNAKPLPDKFKELIRDNVTFLSVPLDEENSIFKINRLLYSSYHTYSAIIVAEIIKYFDSLLEEKDNWTIGLIAPYKAQAILLNKLITSYGISNRLKIYSDTVHGFQGDECDIVFFVANPNNYWYTGHYKALLSKEYIYNVAISRARDYLIILHPFEAIENNFYINTIRTSYSRNFGTPEIRKAAEFEKILFNHSNFIEKNSYLTGHDNVNVFGQIEMKYFIKSNENAIDIQLRKI